MKHICVVTPCFNEEENVQELYERIKAVFAKLPQYTYAQLFIDNASRDQTVARIKEIAAGDKNVKLIVNTRNFGHIRSPYYALLQSDADATICMVSDLQDPPELIPDFLAKWEEGYKIVIGVKATSAESTLMRSLRTAYYTLASKLSEIELIQHVTGFGCYDRAVVQTLRKIDDPYPYFRGLIADIGYPAAKIAYHQPVRKRGLTKNNFYTLYDLAMLGITNHSKVPLRLATIFGFVLSMVAMLLALLYLVLKLCFWSFFQQGYAPMLIAVFLFSSVQLFFIGIIGEYIGAIHTQVQKRPLVIEKERVNFDDTPPRDSASSS